LPDRIPAASGQQSGTVRTVFRSIRTAFRGIRTVFAIALSGVVGRDREKVLSEEVTQNVEWATGRLNLTALCPEKYS
jgi:hypothetical protein